MLNRPTDLKTGNINLEFQENNSKKKTFLLQVTQKKQPLLSYAIDKQIGQGAFATVYLATVQETLEKVAIKKIPQDKKYKNRELQNHKLLRKHPNVVHMSQAFYVLGQNNDEVYLNLVLEYYPENLRSFIKEYRGSKKQISNSNLRVMTFQMIRGIAYIHAKGLVHRDLKPQNILIDSNNLSIKICDLGSAKILQKGSGNVSYICARYYRAPELIFGSTDYNHTIDIWALGCIIAELVLLEPLFPGESSVDQLVEIMKVLGTPTPEDILSFNVSHNQEFKFPQVKAHPWSKVFLKYKPDVQLIDLIKRMVVYNPTKRISLQDALIHPYFDCIREQSFGDGMNYPDLWKLGEDEKDLYTLDFYKKFIPAWKNH